MINENNKYTCINYVWVIDFNKFNGLKKIINGEDIEIQDIIPNFKENTENSQINRYFLQNIVSWTILKKDNPIRLITHFAYLESLGKLIKNQCLEKQKLEGILNPKEDFSEFDNFLKELKENNISTNEEKQQIIKKKLQDKIQFHFNTKITLEQIETKYQKCFSNFETKLQQYNENFEIVSFKNLILSNEQEDKEITNDHYLHSIINDEIPIIHHIIDYIKLSVNYYGFGYKKNLIIDLDHTPKSIGNGRAGEVNNFDYKIKFGLRNPFDEDQDRTSIENQICFTKEDKNTYLKQILCSIQNNKSYEKYKRPNNIFMFHAIRDSLFELVDSYQNALNGNNQDKIREYETKIKMKFLLENPKEILRIKILDSQDRMARPDKNSEECQSTWIKDCNENPSHEPNFETPNYWLQDEVEQYNVIPNTLSLLAFYKEAQIEY